MGSYENLHRKDRAVIDQVFWGLQFVAANLLMLVSVVIVLAYLFTLALSLIPNGGMMPWTAAGIILYGVMFVVLASFPAFFGIVWAYFISTYVGSVGKQFLKLAVRINVVTLGIGAATAVVMLFVAGFHR